jgi:hypothetical protein
MPRVIIQALCDDIRHEVNNKVSLMGIFENFNVNDFTKGLPPFHVYAKVGFETNAPVPLQLELRSVEGQRIFVIEANANLGVEPAPDGLYYTNFDSMLQNLKLPRPGVYEFVIRANNQSIGLIHFTASVQTPPLVQ